MWLLNCLVAAVPARERVITCEEVFVLIISPTHVESGGSCAPVAGFRSISSLTADAVWSAERTTVKTMRDPINAAS
jgi:hypothetical protein